MSSSEDAGQPLAPFSSAELDYLSSQRLGRLATIAPDGSPQNNPVSFSYNAELGTIDIGGYRMGASRKFRNLLRNDRVAFVVDDIASVTPWRVRCLEIRGVAEALTGQTPAHPGMAAEVIRIHPRRVLSFGVGQDGGAAAPGESATAAGSAVGGES